MLPPGVDRVDPAKPQLPIDEGQQQTEVADGLKHLDEATHPLPCLVPEGAKRLPRPSRGAAHE